jgi:hypothetical protein
MLVLPFSKLCSNFIVREFKYGKRKMIIKKRATKLQFTTIPHLQTPTLYITCTIKTEVDDSIVNQETLVIINN